MKTIYRILIAFTVVAVITGTFVFFASCGDSSDTAVVDTSAVDTQVVDIQAEDTQPEEVKTVLIDAPQETEEAGAEDGSEDSE